MKKFWKKFLLFWNNFFCEEYFENEIGIVKDAELLAIEDELSISK